MYLFWERETERQRERMSRGGAGRGRERIPSSLRAVSMEPDMGLKLMNREIMTGAEIKSRTLNQLSPPGAPQYDPILTNYTCNEPISK